MRQFALIGLLLAVLGLAPESIWGAQPAALRPVEMSSTPTAATGYDADEARDPMKSLLPTKPREDAHSANPKTTASAKPAVPPAPPSGKLEGLFWGGYMPQAIISGDVYAVGDHLREATIVGIDRDGVVLQTAGGTYRLTQSSDKATLLEPARPTDDGAQAGALGRALGDRRIAQQQKER